VTLMSLGLEDVRGLADQGVAHDDIQGISSAEQRMLNSWERQIAYCQKYCELLSKRTSSSLMTFPGASPP
jgi:hypothetical protein